MADFTGIEIACCAVLIKDAVVRTAQSGRDWVSARAVVDAGKGNEEMVVIAGFSPEIVNIASLLKQHVKIYVEGKIRLRSWQDSSNGEVHPQLAITASKIEPMGVIGQKRVKTKQAQKKHATNEEGSKKPLTAPLFDDPLPF